MFPDDEIKRLGSGRGRIPEVGGRTVFASESSKIVIGGGNNKEKRLRFLFTPNTWTIKNHKKAIMVRLRPLFGLIAAHSLFDIKPSGQNSPLKSGFPTGRRYSIMKRRSIGIALIISIFSLFCFTGLVSSGGFSDRNFRGNYGYSFEAQFGEGLALRAVEAGVFTVDGRGTLIGTGTAVTEGAGPIEANYSCSYVVNPDGQVPVECDRTTAITGTVLVKFLLVLTRGSREAHFVGIPTVSPFDVLRLIGSATRQ